MGARMCERHDAQWQKWAGGPDGWGPHNPLPRGVTVKVMDAQLKAIREACATGRGCTGEKA